MIKHCAQPFPWSLPQSELCLLAVAMVRLRPAMIALATLHVIRIHTRLLFTVHDISFVFQVELKN
jgi:hypothetical protein